MLLLVLILVLVAFGLLVVALLTGNVLCAWLSVVVSVAAAVVLIVDWLQRRSAEKAGRAGADTAAPQARVPADHDPVTEVLPVVAAGGEAAGSQTTAVDTRFESGAAAQRTVVIPAVQPSGSVGRPSGAEAVTTPSGGSSPRTVTTMPADSSTGDGGRESGGGSPATERGDAEATVVVDIRKRPSASEAVDAEESVDPTREGVPTERPNLEKVPANSAADVAESVRPVDRPSWPSRADAQAVAGSPSAAAQSGAASSAASGSTAGSTARLSSDEPGAVRNAERHDAEADARALASGRAASESSMTPSESAPSEQAPTDPAPAEPAPSGGAPSAVPGSDVAASGAAAGPTGSSMRESVAAEVNEAMARADRPTDHQAAVASHAADPAPRTSWGEPGRHEPNDAGAARHTTAGAADGAAASAPGDSDPQATDGVRPASGIEESPAAPASPSYAEMPSYPDMPSHHETSAGPQAVDASPGTDAGHARATFGGPVVASGHELFDPVERSNPDEQPAAESTSVMSPAVNHAPIDEGEPPEEPLDPPVARVVATLVDQVMVVDEQPRYHVSGCRGLIAQSTIPLPAREAVELGFTPCGWCTPDAVLGSRHHAGARP